MSHSVSGHVFYSKYEDVDHKFVLYAVSIYIDVFKEVHGINIIIAPICYAG